MKCPSGRPNYEAFPKIGKEHRAKLGVVCVCVCKLMIKCLYDIAICDIHVISGFR